jgi:hypothetical protein
MNKFLSKFKGWAHWFSGVAVSAVTIYATVPAVHDAINNAIAGNKTLTAIIGAIGSIVLAYSNAQKGPNA